MTITTSHTRPAHLILSHDLSHGRAQRVDVERFRHHGTHTEACGMVIEVCSGRQQKDGYLRLFRPSTPRQEGLPVHLRHAEVEQDHVGRPSVQKVESVLTARTDPNVPPFVRERKFQQLTDRDVIVHDEYTRSVSYHHAS